MEIFLQRYYGFRDAVLLKKDPDFEYIAQANQTHFRFRDHIKYNSYSMRSAAVDTTSEIMLGFGDSVINGGSLTDQDSLATTILSDTLSKLQGKKIQFLNISAGSWGPDNCYAYLKKYGNFGAKYIFLFVSSHDAYDNMGFENIVGVSKNFPAKQYSSSLYELFDRYLIPRIKNTFNLSAGVNKKKSNTGFNTGFESILSYSTEKKIPFIVYLHADEEELKSNYYNAQGREIIRFAEENNIPIIQDLKSGLTLSDFRDGIHLNSQGQKGIVNTIIKYLDTSTTVVSNGS